MTAGDARDAIDSLRLQNARLEVENSAYRAAGAQLTRNVASLQAAIDDLSSRTGLNAAVDGTIERLPTAVAATALPIATVPTPGPTFDRLDDLLGTLDSELQEVRRGVAFREALAPRDTDDVAGRRVAVGFLWIPHRPLYRGT